MRSEAAQPRFAAASVGGSEPTRVSGDFWSRSAAPVIASAVQVSHGFGRGGSSESGAPPVPGNRTNAIRRPSGDQRGERSRANAGASQVIAVVSFVYKPIRE